MAEIIAQSGDRFLARVADGIVRVIDLGTKTVGPRMSDVEVLANGNWEPSINRPEILESSRSFKWQKNPDG